MSHVSFVRTSHFPIAVLDFHSKFNFVYHTSTKIEWAMAPIKCEAFKWDIKNCRALRFGNSILRYHSLFDSCKSGFTIVHINQHNGPNACVIKSLTKHGKSYHKIHSHMFWFHWKGMVLLISNSKYKTQSKGNDT